MRIHVFSSPFYAANAAVIVPEGESRALVVDPSAGVQRLIARALDAEKVSVGAVLATHGHPDHVWDCAEVASWWTYPEGGAEAELTSNDTSGDHRTEAPVYIPAPDMYRMDNPAAHTQGLPPIELTPWCRPADVRPFPGGSVDILPGLWLKMVPAPGHTEGSALFIGHCDITVFIDGQVAFHSDTPVPWALSGDVIFAGSVGRTDLAGGDETQMRHSLRTVSNALDPLTVLLPGHGPMTSLEREISSNPYLIRARSIG
ncbi:MBL fold metallo-hydrolase [Schaalia sp. ZJ1691]|uniref:MBL fold metallo-hydrolase n=1 Tax=Schaalia sp. ZJ1691 TaxID=2709404 RepID=UPI0013EB0C7B|nr:MBL fold metallo-hydrolase [Schaalia sp. ZJ1691]